MCISVMSNSYFVGYWTYILPNFLLPLSYHYHTAVIQEWDRISTIDYIVVRRDEIRNIKDCKVISGECVATQHRLVVMEMNVEMTRKPRQRIKQQKTKWWNLEKDEYKLNFLPKAQEIIAYVTP